MKKLHPLFLFLILLAGTGLAAGEDTYQNPMTVPGQYGPFTATADDYGIGDPFVMRFNGRYYLYASSCEERVRVYTSDNLIDWEYRGYCTEGRDVYFAYAPEVLYWRGDFYMITSPGGGGHYILRSEDPLGIFRPITKNFGYSIDGSLFVQDNGELLMMFPESSSIKQTEIDEKTMLPTGPRRVTGANLRHWTEGPGLFRRGDWYYLTFTGNHVCSPGYRVAYASRKDGPLGTFIQPEDCTLLINSVFTDDFKGLGHSSNVTGPDLDSMYTAYHNLVSLTGPARQYNLDRLFTNGGVLYTTGPTDFAMPIPHLPAVYGDLAADNGDFIENEEGWFAQIAPTAVFTQECNFSLDGGTACWQVGEKDGKAVRVLTDGKQMTLLAGDGKIAAGKVPELGRAGRLHTLRIECNAQVLYASIDGMRILTVRMPGITAGTIGAVKAAGAQYSFIACEPEALGSSDYKAEKTIPGTFHAIHALPESAVEAVPVGPQEALAARLDRAVYPVRIGKAGVYCFDVTVSPQDAGKTLSLYLDDDLLTKVVIPAWSGKKTDRFTFTVPPLSLPSGAHRLTLAGSGVLVFRVSSFLSQPVAAFESDFTTQAFRQTYYTLGNFSQKNQEGILSVKANKGGLVLFGEEGYTDYELYVRFRIPVEGIGASGILLRATDASWYQDQVNESYFGYSISLSKLGLNVRRIRYGASGSTDFANVSAWKNAAEGELILRAQGGTVTLLLPDGTELLSLRDAEPFTHGKVGFFSTGKELTVLECNLRPLEREATAE